MKIVLATALAFASARACAAPFTVTDVEPDRAQIITLGGPLPAPINAYVGRLDLTTSTGKTLEAWCIDLFHDVNVGAGQSLAYTTGAIRTDNHGALLSVVQREQIAGLVHQGDALLAAGGTSTNSAATQLAIWSVEYPDFTYWGAPDATRAETNRLIASAPRISGGERSLVALSGTQSFAGAVDAPPSAALLLGAVGLAWAGRRLQWGWRLK